MRTPKRIGEAKGFTLVELAIVLAIVAILSTVVVPDFIEVARNDLAQQAAREMTLILDTSKWYYANSGTWQGSDFRPDDMRWPGDYTGNDSENGSNAAENCLIGAGPGSILGISLRCDVGYLPRSALQNPWGGQYEINLGLANGGINVATNVPESVAGVIRSFVPGGECQNGFNGGAGAPQYCGPMAGQPAGFVTCCATIPRPGREASFQEMVNQLSPDGDDECDSTGCSPVNRNCPEGCVQRGLFCGGGKDCTSPQPVCCRTLE